MESLDGARAAVGQRPPLQTVCAFLCWSLVRNGRSVQLSYGRMAPSGADCPGRSHSLPGAFGSGPRLAYRRPDPLMRVQMDVSCFPAPLDREAPVRRQDLRQMHGGTGRHEFSDLAIFVQADVRRFVAHVSFLRRSWRNVSARKRARGAICGLGKCVRRNPQALSFRRPSFSRFCVFKQPLRDYRPSGLPVFRSVGAAIRCCFKRGINLLFTAHHPTPQSSTPPAPPRLASKIACNLAISSDISRCRLRAGEREAR